MSQFPLFQNPSLSVSDVTRYLRAILESDEILQDVWVAGEVSNLSMPSSGHIYFSLKDENATMKCVIWRRDAARLKAAIGGMQNGQAVEARGAVNIYEQGGQYQLYVTNVRIGGEGLLYLEFMRLKARLEAEGLFETDRKRPLPKSPLRIGIVTSPTGAALQDMLNTLGQRYPIVEAIVSPCSVQGADSPAEIVAAIRLLCEHENPDVIIVARGGGSMEDLWAFNDERVVRAICGSAIPIITGIGHETDFTLSDFAADLRAPTPTGAAVLATPDIEDYRIDLNEARRRLVDATLVHIEGQQYEYNQAAARLRSASPLRAVLNQQQRLDEDLQRLQRALSHALVLKQAHLKGAVSRLGSLNPRAVLQRGYAIVSRPDGRIIRTTADVNAGLNVRVDVSDGSFQAEVKE